jgi:O-antigen ligase/tetratricopeptide (TPR) repeat protein
MILLLVALLLLKFLSAEPGPVEVGRPICRLTLPAFLLVSLVSFQMVPLPPALERVASPSTFKLYQKTLPGWPEKPVYDFLAPSHASKTRVVLPTSDEVMRDIAVPLVKTGKQSELLRDDEVRLAKSVGVWRPLSVDTSLTWPALLKLVAYVCLFILVTLCPSGEKGEASLARNLLQAALLAGVSVATVTLAGQIFSNEKPLWIFAPYDWGKGNPWGPRATGSFANPDHLANYLDLTLPIAFAGFFLPSALASRGRTAMRLFCGAAVILIASALLFSCSRGGWLGALIGSAILAGLWPKHHEQGARRPCGMAAWASPALLLLLVALFIGPEGRTQADVRLKATVAQLDLLGRMRPAEVSLGIVRDFPIFGIGLGCWPEVFPHYRPPPWSPIFWNATHNDYVQIASETGILGFALLAWFLAAAFGRVWRGIQLRGGAARVLLAACIAGMAAAGVQEFFDFPLQIPANALLFTVLLGVAVRLTVQSSSQQLDSGQWRRRLRYGCALISIIGLVGAAIGQQKTPYPYNLQKPTTLVRAYALINAHPANARAHLMLASLLGDAALVERRIRELRAAIWLEPTNPLARDLYAQALLQIGHEEAALSEITQSVSYSPTLESHFYLERRMIPWLSPAERTAVELGFRAATADHYQGAVENFASYYETLENFPAEAAIFREAAIRTDNAELRANYFVAAGTAYVMAGERPQAEAAFDAALAAVPQDPVAYQQLVLRVFGPEHNLAAAAALVAEGIDRGVDACKLYLALASAAQAAGDNSEAEAALEKALAVEPSSFEALMQIGALDLASNRFDRAAAWLLRATQADPSSAEAFYQLGLADEGAYEYFAADKAYQHALNLAPNDQRFRAHYAAFRQKVAQNRTDKVKP